MLRLASDADVHGDILRGLRRRLPEIDLRRSQDVFPRGTPDPEILEWAAQGGRILLTNDRSTMVGFAYQRVRLGMAMPGVIVTNNEQSIGRAIDELELLIEFMSPDEIRVQMVIFLPFLS